MRELNDYDFGLRTEIDVTTDPLYQFVSKTLNPAAEMTASEWVCYRITVATGTKKFAIGPTGTPVTNFNKKENLLKASLAATYTY